jgi:zinc protease
MAGGQSSRLYKTLVDEEQMAVVAGSFPLSLEDPGVIIAFGIANVGINPNDLEALMDKEFANVQKDLIPEKEFQKLRNQVEDDFVSQNTSVQGIAENLAVYEVQLGDANLINTELERYLNVSREDIRRVAKKYFTADNRVVLYYLPKANQ